MTATAGRLELAVDHGEIVKSEAMAWPERAAALQVTDAASYQAGGELLKAIKGLRNRISEVFDKHISAAHAAHKALVREKAEAEAPLTLAESTIKRSLIIYTEAEERARREEERRLAEEARKVEEERRFAEAAALEAEAIESGDATMLAVAQEIASTPVAAPVVVLPSATPKVAGISYREVWRFRITDPNLIPRQYMTPNEQAIGGVVRSLKGATQIPGVEVYSERVAAASGR